MIKKTSHLFKLAIASCLILTMGCQKNKLEQSDAGSLRKKTVAHSVEGNLSYATTIGTNIQEFTELPDIQPEFNRMKARVPWTNYEATGIYVAPNTTFSVTVQQLQGTRLPVMLIGTKLRAYDPGNPVETQLTAGVNTLSSGQ